MMLDCLKIIYVKYSIPAYLIISVKALYIQQSKKQAERNKHVFYERHFMNQATNSKREEKSGKRHVSMRLSSAF